MILPSNRGLRWVALWVLAASICGVWAWAAHSADVLRVRNGAVSVGFHRGTGRLVELVDRESGRNFVRFDTNAAAGDLWRIEFGGDPARTVGPAQAAECRVEKDATDESGLVVRWSGFESVRLPGLRVEVKVGLEAGAGASRWRIAVEGTGGREIQRIRFPRVLDLPHRDDERLVMPSWGGLLTSRPRRVFATVSTNGVRHEFDYPGRCSMQCMAFYSEGGPGVYAACDDAAGFRKSFAAFSQPGSRLHLEIVHQPENGARGADRYELPYGAVLGTFRGTWYDAATRYRIWATNQVWARESRWKKGLVPKWIGDTGVWVWNRGRSTNVLGPALALRERTGLPVSVFWHWWHGCSYDTGFPEYLPPREGSDPFRDAMGKAHAGDVHTLVYMNQRLWGMSTASWTNEQAEVHAVKAADGKVKPEVYNTFKKLPCATMCMGTRFWRFKYAGLATEAFSDLGVDGIYMDQACTSLSCHDPAHGHARGGGTYWMEGFKTMAADIRERCQVRGDVALAGEGCAENWLPYLDLMLALDVSRDRYVAPDRWEAVPFFHAVYHGYGVFYGNYSSLTMPPYDDLWPAETAPKVPLRLLDAKYSKQFLLEQARSFVWGQQPTVANFRPEQFSTRTNEIAFVLRLAAMRQRALKFLQDGTMLAPVDVSGPDARIPISRLSIYAGQQGGLTEYHKRVPLVLASAWLASDGTVGVAVASAADRAVRATLKLDAEALKWSKGGAVERYTGSGVESAGRAEGARWSLPVALGPQDVQFFEIRKGGNGR